MSGALEGYGKLETIKGKTGQIENFEVEDEWQPWDILIIISSIFIFYVRTQSSR